MAATAPSKSFNGTYLVMASLPSVKELLRSAIETHVAKDDLLTGEPGITPKEGPIPEDHHVTIHMGIPLPYPDDVSKSLEPVRELCNRTAPFDIAIRDIEVFSNKKEVDGVMKYYDVVVMKAETSDGSTLKALHDELEKLYDVKWPFPDYKPHCTVVYLKEGKGKQYAPKLKETLSSQKVVVKSLACAEWMKFDTTKVEYPLLG